MVKKITDRNGHPEQGSDGKPLQAKRLKLKRLHKKTGESRADLQGLAPDRLPPASSGNAARQARSRLDITFPVNWAADWQELHTRKPAEDDEPDRNS